MVVNLEIVRNTVIPSKCNQSLFWLVIILWCSGLVQMLFPTTHGVAIDECCCGATWAYITSVSPREMIGIDCVGQYVDLSSGYCDE